MSSKLERLKQIRNNLNFIVEDQNDYNDNPCLFVANHNCLMDIFYLPMSLDIPIVSLISSRLIYKCVPNRQQMVEDYLYSMPIEAHGGKVYSDICLNSAVNLLNNGINLGIFPEGAYVSENVIYRGRTGMSRILFDTKKLGINVDLIPVAININGEIDMDSYEFDDREVSIKILPKVNYESSYDKFLYTDSHDEKKQALHEPVDTCMKNIAETLNRPYSDEYIELYPKGNVIFSDGKTISTQLAQSNDYISKYEQELINRSKILQKQLLKTTVR